MSGQRISESVHRSVADELRAEIARLTEQSGRYKTLLRQSGVCMSCVDGAPDPWGCTDCLNTGFEGGGPYNDDRVEKLCQELDEAAEAIARLTASYEARLADAYQAAGALIHAMGLSDNADCIRLQDVLAYGKTEDGIDLLPWPRDPEALEKASDVARLTAERDQARDDAEGYDESSQRYFEEMQKAERAFSDLQSRYDAILAERAGVSEAMEHYEAKQQEDADRALMSLEGMAFHWVAEHGIDKVIDAAASIAKQPHAAKLASCIHGLVSQAWIEGADTGFAARRKLTLAAKEEVGRLTDRVTEMDELFERTWEADMRAVTRWRSAFPGNDLILPDRADLVVWLLNELEAALATPIQPASPPPNWDDIRGLAPHATGNLSSEDFVRELRDDWNATPIPTPVDREAIRAEAFEKAAEIDCDVCGGDCSAANPPVINCPKVTP